MKKTICVLLVLFLALLPAFALAAGKATVTQEAFYVTSFLSYYAADLYVEITNTGDRPIVFNGGLLELYNLEGDAIESSNLYSCYPAVLAPGEKGYLHELISVDEATDASYIDDYSLTISGKGENEKTTLRLASTGTFGEEQVSKYFKEYAVTAVVTNDTDELLRNIRVVYALFGDDDKLLYTCNAEPYYVGLPPGQTIEVRTTVDSDIVDVWEKDGIQPARIVTIAYVEK